MLQLFSIRREERWLAIIALVVLFALHALIFYKYGSIITQAHHVSFWNLFGRTYHVSGFDDWTYIFLSNGKIYYIASRHPLFGMMLYPLYWLNSWLMSHGDINYAFFIMAATLIFCAFYSLLFLYRILREVIGLERVEATTLSAMFFSFGMIMTTVIVPDHFCWSLFLLMLTLYVAGLKLKHHRVFKTWQAAVLAFFTAGVTLSNVVKTYLAVLFVNGIRYFNWKRILLVIVLPNALLAGIFCYQYFEIILPQKELDTHIEKVTLAKNKDLAERNKQRHLRVQAKIPKPITEKPFLGWIDITTNRVDAFVENMFGESVQLHDQYLLEDIYEHRPEVVRYSNVYNYVIEAVLVLLLMMGIWMGRKNRFCQLVLSWFAFDLFLHFVLGFGLNEIYIMAAHWMMIIPIALAFVLRHAQGKTRVLYRSLFVLLTLYLWLYNGYLLTQFATDRVTEIFK